MANDDSNAALRSRRTSFVLPWVSTACRRLFWTHNKAVSVLCRWSTRCTHTMSSISVYRKERSQTGRKFFRISQSILVVFRGSRMEFFSSGEKSENATEVLTTGVSTSVSSSIQRLRMDVGPREHDLRGDDDDVIFRWCNHDVFFRTYSWYTMRNALRGTPPKSMAAFIMQFSVLEKSPRYLRTDFTL